MSISKAGRGNRKFISAINDWPPATTRASPPPAANKPTASLRLCGRT